MELEVGDPKPLEIPETFVVCILNVLLQVPGGEVPGPTLLQHQPGPVFGRGRDHLTTEVSAEVLTHSSTVLTTNKHLSPSEQQHSAATLAAATSFHSNVPGPPHTGHGHMWRQYLALDPSQVQPS